MALFAMLKRCMQKTAMIESTMFMNKLTLFSGALAAVGLLTGCQTLPPGAERGPDGTMAYNVAIESSEPGVRIEANNQYIGTTPLTLKIFGDPDGTFHDFGSPEYIVQALPLHTNQFTQTAVFRTGHLFTGEDRIPTRIYFDMNQPPQAQPNYAPGYPPPYYGGYYGPGPYYYGPGIRFYFGGPFRYHHYRRW